VKYFAQGKGIEIQKDTHNSVEDSVAVLQLVFHKLNHPETVPDKPKPLFDVLASCKKKSLFFDRPQLDSHWPDAEIVDNDADCVEKLKNVDFSQVDFVVAQLHGIDDFLAAEAKERFSRLTPNFQPDVAGAKNSPQK